MFVFLFIAVGFVMIVATGVTAWALLQAPVGIENETGFHAEPSLKPADLWAESAKVRRIPEPEVTSTPQPWPSASSR